MSIAPTVKHCRYSLAAFQSMTSSVYSIFFNFISVASSPARPVCPLYKFTALKKNSNGLLRVPPIGFVFSLLCDSVCSGRLRSHIAMTVWNQSQAQKWSEREERESIKWGARRSGRLMSRWPPPDMQMSKRTEAFSALHFFFFFFVGVPPVFFLFR